MGRPFPYSRNSGKSGCRKGDIPEKAAAAAVLCSEERVEELSKKMPVKILGCVAQSGKYSSPKGLTCDPSENVWRTSQMAYEMAGLGPEDMDVAEIHDAFSIAEMMVVESLGFCDKGEGTTLGRNHLRREHSGQAVT